MTEEIIKIQTSIFRLYAPSNSVQDKEQSKKDSRIQTIPYKVPVKELSHQNMNCCCALKELQSHSKDQKITKVNKIKFLLSKTINNCHNIP